MIQEELEIDPGKIEDRMTFMSSYNDNDCLERDSEGVRKSNSSCVSAYAECFMKDFGRFLD